MSTWTNGISLRGPKGEVGSPGLGIIQAEGPPAAGLVGADGQLYVDTASALTDVYRYATSGSAWSKIGTLRGPKGDTGLNGVDGVLRAGDGPPDATTYDGAGQGLYLQSNGKLWTYTEADKWVETDDSFRGSDGADGAPGAPGRRGSVKFEGSGPPPDDVSTLTIGDVVGALPGDEYYDTTSDGAPIRYYLSA